MAFALPVDADKSVVIARNVSELWLVNLVRMVKLPALGQLSQLAKMVLKDNSVRAFPDLSRLRLLAVVELSCMHQLKMLGSRLASAPALASLDVHNCSRVVSMTASFVRGVTAGPGGAARFHTLRVSRCPLVLPEHLQGLVGLRVLSLSEISTTQRAFPRLASFVRLAELSVKHTSFANFPPPADLACLGALQRLELQDLPIETVDAIWLLTNLRSLRMTDLDIRHLPDEIGRLSLLSF